MRYIAIRVGRISLIFVILISTLQSCMMMGPAHMASHGSGSHHTTNVNSVVDPVCGGEIEVMQEELSLKYNGVTYYFHNQECLVKFGESPDNYILNQDPNQEQNWYWWGIGGITMGLAMLLMFL